MAKYVGYSQSAVSKIWCRYKQNGKVIKGKHMGKTSKSQDQKVKAIWLENRKRRTEQMKAKCDPKMFVREL